mmetsp:Transcript_21924/g.54226  ORF Transcript_21924/g.54226 Transcript_21924/m.54226 type:complete len:214 (+) Transcript_21924:429-1070(+)
MPAAACACLAQHAPGAYAEVVEAVEVAEELDLSCAPAGQRVRGVHHDPTGASRLEACSVRLLLVSPLSLGVGASSYGAPVAVAGELQRGFGAAPGRCGGGLEHCAHDVFSVVGRPRGCRGTASCELAPRPRVFCGVRMGRDGVLALPRFLRRRRRREGRGHATGRVGWPRRVECTPHPCHYVAVRHRHVDALMCSALYHLWHGRELLVRVRFL